MTTHTGHLTPELRKGAFNLLVNCVGVGRGERVLLIGEDHPHSFFDPRVCHVLADAVSELGGHAEIVMAPETRGPEDFPMSIARAMREVDHTVFLSRLGNQVRFDTLEGSGTKTMCYLQDAHYLGDPFAQVPYGVFAEVSALLLEELTRMRHCRIECPEGTRLEGRMLPLDEAGSTLTEAFSVTYFPVMIIPPISARGLSGQIVLNRWLMSTSTHRYDGSLMTLDRPLVAHLHEGEIVDFHGEAADVDRVRRHFEVTASRIGGDAFRVNSWHAGINPGTFFIGRAEDDIERWADMAFGSPRYAHVHACGDAPGDIAISLFDATISFDGEIYWESGILKFLDRPQSRDILGRHPESANAFDMRWDIGI